jgi:hypothetical protein
MRAPRCHHLDFLATETAVKEELGIAMLTNAAARGIQMLAFAAKDTLGLGHVGSGNILRHYKKIIAKTTFMASQS